MVFENLYYAISYRVAVNAKELPRGASFFHTMMVVIFPTIVLSVYIPLDIHITRLKHLIGRRPSSGVDYSDFQNAKRTVVR